jgi:hypothetical protein
LHNHRLTDLALNLFAVVSKHISACHTVHEALPDRRWVRDIRGALNLCPGRVPTCLGPGGGGPPARPLVVRYWRHSLSGEYSASSTYWAFFHGSSFFEPAKRLWKSWASTRCKLFLLLAILDRCLTADRQTRRGMPHSSSCTMCDQVDEDV